MANPKSIAGPVNRRLRCYSAISRRIKRKKKRRRVAPADSPGQTTGCSGWRDVTGKKTASARLPTGFPPLIGRLSSPARHSGSKPAFRLVDEPSTSSVQHYIVLAVRKVAEKPRIEASRPLLFAQKNSVEPMMLELIPTLLPPITGRATRAGGLSGIRPRTGFGRWRR
jgi:hypothetical protein